MGTPLGLRLLMHCIVPDGVSAKFVRGNLYCAQRLHNPNTFYPSFEVLKIDADTILSDFTCPQHFDRDWEFMAFLPIDAATDSPVFAELGIAANEPALDRFGDDIARLARPTYKKWRAAEQMLTALCEILADFLDIWSKSDRIGLKEIHGPGSSAQRFLATRYTQFFPFQHNYGQTFRGAAVAKDRLWTAMQAFRALSALATYLIELTTVRYPHIEGEQPVWLQQCYLQVPRQPPFLAWLHELSRTSIACGELAPRLGAYVDIAAAPGRDEFLVALRQAKVPLIYRWTEPERMWADRTGWLAALEPAPQLNGHADMAQPGPAGHHEPIDVTTRFRELRIGPVRSEADVDMTDSSVEGGAWDEKRTKAMAAKEVLYFLFGLLPDGAPPAEGVQHADPNNKPLLKPVFGWPFEAADSGLIEMSGLLLSGVAHARSLCESGLSLQMWDIGLPTLSSPATASILGRQAQRCTLRIQGSLGCQDAGKRLWLLQNAGKCKHMPWALCVDSLGALFCLRHLQRMGQSEQMQESPLRAVGGELLAAGIPFGTWVPDRTAASPKGPVPIQNSTIFPRKPGPLQCANPRPRKSKGKPRVDPKGIAEPLQCADLRPRKSKYDPEVFAKYVRQVRALVSNRSKYRAAARAGGIVWLIVCQVMRGNVKLADILDYRPGDGCQTVFFNGLVYHDDVLTAKDLVIISGQYAVEGQYRRSSQGKWYIGPAVHPE